MNVNRSSDVVNPCYEVANGSRNGQHSVHRYHYDLPLPRSKASTQTDRPTDLKPDTNSDELIDDSPSIFITEASIEDYPVETPSSSPSRTSELLIASPTKRPSLFSAANERTALQQENEPNESQKRSPQMACRSGFTPNRTNKTSAGDMQLTVSAPQTTRVSSPHDDSMYPNPGPLNDIQYVNSNNDSSEHLIIRNSTLSSNMSYTNPGNTYYDSAPNQRPTSFTPANNPQRPTTARNVEQQDYFSQNNAYSAPKDNLGEVHHQWSSQKALQRPSTHGANNHVANGSLNAESLRGANISGSWRAPISVHSSPNIVQERLPLTSSTSSRFQPNTSAEKLQPYFSTMPTAPPANISGYDLKYGTNATSPRATALRSADVAEIPFTHRVPEENVSQHNGLRHGTDYTSLRDSERLFQQHANNDNEERRLHDKERAHNSNNGNHRALLPDRPRLHSRASFNVSESPSIFGLNDMPPGIHNLQSDGKVNVNAYSRTSIPQTTPDSTPLYPSVPSRIKNTVVQPTIPQQTVNHRFNTGSIRIRSVKPPLQYPPPRRDFPYRPMPPTGFSQAPVPNARFVRVRNEHTITHPEHASPEQQQQRPSSYYNKPPHSWPTSYSPNPAFTPSHRTPPWQGTYADAVYRPPYRQPWRAPNTYPPHSNVAPVPQHAAPSVRRPLVSRPPPESLIQRPRPLSVPTVPTPRDDMYPRTQGTRPTIAPHTVHPKKLNPVNKMAQRDVQHIFAPPPLQYPVQKRLSETTSHNTPQRPLVQRQDAIRKTVKKKDKQ